MGTRSFPAGDGALVYQPAGPGGALLAKTGSYVTIYTDEAATTVATGLTYPDGSPVVDGRLLVNATSRLPRFRDPAGRLVLYSKPDVSTVVTALYADSEEFIATADQTYSKLPPAGTPTVYVRVNGDDANSGLTWGAPKATLAAAQAALPATGGRIVVGIGTFLGSLVVDRPLSIDGAGEAYSRLQLPSGANTSVISLATPDTSALHLRGLTIDGNKTNQTAGEHHGIVLNNDTTAAAIRAKSPTDEVDPRHVLDDVTVMNCRGRGVWMKGRGLNHLTNVKVLRCDGIGIVVGSFDTTLIGCDVGKSGLEGIKVTALVADGYGSACRIIGCKTWFSGQVTAGSGDGISVNSPQVQVVGCESQDNTRHGLVLSNVRDVIVAGFAADTNGALWANDAMGDSGVTAAGILLFNATDCNIQGAVYDRGSGTPFQDYGVQFSGTCTGNVVTVKARNNRLGPYTGTTSGNTVIINERLLLDGCTVYTGTTTGTVIGESAAAKLGFYGKTPAARVAAINNTTGATLAQLEAEVNALKTTLRTYGLIPV